MASQTLETAFTMDISSIKYEPGVTREVGEFLAQATIIYQTKRTTKKEEKN